MAASDVREKDTDTNGGIEAQLLAQATARLERRISAEPAYQAVLYKILAYCDPARPCAEVERAIRAFPEMKRALQSPQTLLSWLADSGGLEQIAARRNKPMWRTTAAGRSIVRTESGQNRLSRLLEGETVYRDIYLQVLRSCLQPQSRAEIESMLRGNPALEQPKLYPSFFIEALEGAGGLEWNEKWGTTQAGKDFLQQIK